MKLRYLGTAAAEGFPALFCNCEFCREAKKLGGKNVRTRSQALVNEDLLLDFPADTYFHFLNNGIDGHKIAYLLVTHSHSDHLYPKDFGMRVWPFSHEMEKAELNVYCSPYTAGVIGDEYKNVRVTAIEPFAPVKLGEYTVTALPARHMTGCGAYFYIVEGEKTLLYAHDTGYFFDEVFEYIEKNKLHFDMVSFDCTNVDIPVGDDGCHMGLPNIKRVISRLEDMNAIDQNTVKYVNHFSHNGNPLHHIMEEKAAAIGCGVSYDGCEVEF